MPVGKPFPVLDSSCDNQTQPGNTAFTSNYCLTKKLHADKKLVDDPASCDGDELCSFRSEYVLPRFFVKYRIHNPRLRTSAGAGLARVFDAIPKLRKGVFAGSEANLCPL